MKKIIDVNYLRDNRLRDYLEEDKNNFILLTDYASMESFKGQSLVNIKNSMEIISDFSEQVLVLKNTVDVMKEDLSHPWQNDFLIDQQQSIGFRDFCREVKQASEGNSFFADHLLKKSELASLAIEQKKESASLVFKGIEQFSKELDQEFVKVLRTREPWTSSEYDYIWRTVIELCKLMFKKQNEVPNKDTFIRHYIFRYSLVCYLFALKWISEGGWQSYPKEDMRNDLIDMSYVAYATYFDGVLSKDNKINELYKKTTDFIGKLKKA